MNRAASSRSASRAPSPPVSRSRGRPRWCCGCATSDAGRCRTWPSRSIPSPSPATFRGCRSTSARSGSSKRARGDRQAPRRERDGQPARRWPDRLRQHLGARRDRARTDAHVRLARRAGEERPAPRALHGRGRPLRQGPHCVRGRRATDRPVPRAHRSATPGNAHRPHHRQGHPGRLPGPVRTVASSALPSNAAHLRRAPLARCRKIHRPAFATRRCQSSTFALRFLLALAPGPASTAVCSTCPFALP